MMMSYIDIPTTPKECLKKYIESLASLFVSLSPDILPDEVVTICLWKDYMGIWFDMQFIVRFDHSFL